MDRTHGIPVFNTTRTRMFVPREHARLQFISPILSAQIFQRKDYFRLK